MPEFAGQVTHVELSTVPLWLIVALPFAGFAINVLFGRRLQRSSWQRGLMARWHIGSPAVSAVAVGVLLGALVLSIAATAQLAGLEPGHRHLYSHAWQMVRIGSLDVSFAFALDPLSAVMALVVTGVGSLIHVYSTSYMADDPSYWRFFCYLNLFIFSMLLLVLGDNLVVMFFGWEGVGLCSYLLIGFAYQDYGKASAGMKAFVVNRVGDFGFVCGMALLFWGLGGAWSGLHGRYQPDGRARFIAIEAEALAHGGEHRAHRSGQVAHSPQEHGGKAEPGDHGVGALVGRGVGTLTMTSHAGARVYLGVHSMEQLERGHVEPCTSKPVWTSKSGPQITADCYAVAPFVRKRVAALLQTVVIVPGHGAVVAGDGDEVASVRVQVREGREVVIAAAGPSLTFREIHDQMVLHTTGASAWVDHPDHASELSIPAADVEAGRAHQYAFTSGGHSHRFELQAADFEQLTQQGRVTVATDPGGADGHTHHVTVRRPMVLREGLLHKRMWGIAIISLACLLFFLGATGKSAQIPLYVWLPDAMAGPTPVSALIHAATMVTAGVYMVARMSFLFGLSVTASGAIALIGALTALFAATIGFFQYDIKKVLAYSTISQLGFMFIGVGVGAYWAAIFHLMTHAFFKACLFLGSGSVIHGMHAAVHDEAGAQDMRNMGGLERVMPITAKTYFVACLAITAAPIPLLAGFWSKDEILWKAFNAQSLGHVPALLVYGLGLVAALGTSFYMWRSYYLTFTGEHVTKSIAKRVHESPWPMSYVLAVLAFLAAFAGVVFGISTHFTSGAGEGILPEQPWLEQWLHPSVAHQRMHFGDAGHSAMYLLMLLSVAGAVAAWYLARQRYGPGRAEDWEQQEAKLPAFGVLHNKYWVDEIYQATAVRAVLGVRVLCGEMDRWIVDGIVNGVGVLGRVSAWVSGAIDRYLVDGLVDLVANGTLAAGERLRAVQTGRIQSYVYGTLGGVAVLAILQYLLG